MLSAGFGRNPAEMQHKINYIVSDIVVIKSSIVLSNMSICKKTDGGLVVQQGAAQTAVVNQSDFICISSSPSRRKTCMSLIGLVAILALGFIGLATGKLGSVDLAESGVKDNVILAKVASKMQFRLVQDSIRSVSNLPRSMVIATTRDLLVLWVWKCLANTRPNQVVNNTVSGGFQVLDQYQQSPRISKSMGSGYSLIRFLIYYITTLLINYKYLPLKT